MVLVEDECRIQRESDLNSIWYPEGKYPEIKVEQKKEARCFYGVLDLKAKRCHLRDFSRMVSKNTVEVLRGLEKEYQGKKVLLVWDGAPWHRGEVRKYLAEPKKWNLWIEYFPAYHPDLNPQEHVWKEARRNVTHNCELSFDDKLLKFWQFITQPKFKTNFLQKYMPP